MGLELVQGNLFEADSDAIAHGCNCRGAMGAGIAAEFRRRWPAMFLQYAQLCRRRMFSIGSVFTWPAEKHRFDTVYNLGTQVAPGADATPFAVALAFQHLGDVMWARGERSVAIPLIGCGIGGLSWGADVRPEAEKLAERVDVTVYYLSPKDLR